MRSENKLLTACRREAKERSKKLGISHCQALDLIAKEFGYTSWARVYEIQKDLKDTI